MENIKFEMYINKEIEKIAQKELNIKSLKTSNSDSLDFPEVSVWSLREALKQAFYKGLEYSQNNLK